MWNCREKENESEINCSNEYKIQQEFWLFLKDLPEVWNILEQFCKVIQILIESSPDGNWRQLVWSPA